MKPSFAQKPPLLVWFSTCLTTWEGATSSWVAGQQEASLRPRGSAQHPQGSGGGGGV